MPKRARAVVPFQVTATRVRFGASWLQSLKSGTFSVARRFVNATSRAAPPSNATDAVKSCGAPSPANCASSSTRPVL